MDRAPAQSNEPDSVTISYRGAEAGGEAAELRAGLLEELNLDIGEPTQMLGASGRLGIGELVISVVLGAIAKETVSRVLSWLLKRLGTSKRSKIKVVITLRGSVSAPGRDYRFSIKEANSDRLERMLLRHVEERGKDIP